MHNIFRSFSPEVIQDQIRKEYGTIAIVKIFFGGDANGNIVYIEVDSWAEMKPLVNLSELYFNVFDARKDGSKYTMIINQSNMK